MFLQQNSTEEPTLLLKHWFVPIHGLNPRNNWGSASLQCSHYPLYLLARNQYKHTISSTLTYVIWNGVCNVLALASVFIWESLLEIIDEIFCQTIYCMDKSLLCVCILAFQALLFQECIPGSGKRHVGSIFNNPWRSGASL